jgi:hypothetical protein
MREKPNFYTYFRRLQLKGTLAQDFQLHFFFHQMHAPGPLIPTLDYYYSNSRDSRILKSILYEQNMQKDIFCQTRAK